MRLRKLDAAGDMIFGSGQSDYWHNVPEGVGQWAMSRLRLNEGEWFADLTEGTPWATEVLGERTVSTRDLVVRERVQTTPGVVEITQYGSQINVSARSWTAAMMIDTVFGTVTVAIPLLPGNVPPLVPVSVPFVPARLLGVTGTAATPVTMKPADLTVEGRSDITDFRITTLDGMGDP